MQRDAVAAWFSRGAKLAHRLLDGTLVVEKHFRSNLWPREYRESASEACGLAGTNLGKIIATDAAVEALLQNSNAYNERVLASVVSALGQIGNESALDLIIEVQERREGLAAAKAEFATKPGRRTPGSLPFVRDMPAHSIPGSLLPATHRAAQSSRPRLPPYRCA